MKSKGVGLSETCIKTKYYKIYGGGGFLKSEIFFAISFEWIRVYRTPPPLCPDSGGCPARGVANARKREAVTQSASPNNVRYTIGNQSIHRESP